LLGTTDLDFLDGILCQLLNVGSRAAKVDERGLNFLLSVVKGVKPRDQVEALLAAQMAAVHAATMTLALRLGCTEVWLSHLTALDFFGPCWSEGLVGHMFLSFIFDDASWNSGPRTTALRGAASAA
jgi:hypothetical protein